MGAGKLLALRFDARNHRHSHPLLGKPAVDVENGQRFLLGFLEGGVRGVTFLPEELRRAQEKARAALLFKEFEF